MKRIIAIALCAFALAWAPLASAQQVSSTRLDLILNDVAATQAQNTTYWYGGRGTFIVEAGTWGGGSVTLEWQSPQGTWIVAGPEGIVTQNALVGFELPPGYIRATRATATGVYAYIFGSLVK